MKREIEFQMWIKESKVMIPHKDINYGHVLDYKENHDDIELREFTGLVDKNGKKIFEGDVLNKKTTYQNNMADKRFQPSTQLNVGFDNGCFVDTNTGVSLFDKMRNLGYNPSGWTDYEIIGNVYSNPELL